jgi:two-component system sensor histidine kinase BaeS
MVFGALVLSGLASLALAVHQTRVQTQRELVREGTELARTVQDEAQTNNKTDPARALDTLLRDLQSPLRLEDSAVLVVRPNGDLFSPARPRVKASLPSGLSVGEVQPQKLLDLITVSGHSGSLVYAAVPYRAEIQINKVTLDVTQVVILTRRPPSGLESAGLWFAGSSLVILVVALLVARRLGRRFARPIEAAEVVTHRIANGDLDARVPVTKGADPELASLAGAINSMADALARAQGAERQFLLSVSHDLRTPLTSIRGFAEAIEDGMVPDVGHAAEVIAAEARRLERLVSDLLALAALEARRFTLRLEQLDLGQTVATAAAGFAPSAAELGLALTVDHPPGPPIVVYSDPDRLGQVVANLIENALRFARGRIRVTTANNGNGPEVWVEDDGPGIAPADQPRVFARHFADGPRPGRPIASGLGLAIVAELTAAMGGSVRVVSPVADYGGTRMVVSLPPSPG